MKVRSGFVSNSSSSSYIIGIHRTFEEIMDEIDYPSAFYTFIMIPKLESTIAEYKNKLSTPNDLDTPGYSILHMKEFYERQIKISSKLLKFAKRAQKDPNKYQTSFIEEVLKGRGINFEEENGYTVFKYMSTIHNSFNDIGDVLSAICLWYLFHRPDLIRATEIPDS